MALNDVTNDQPTSGLGFMSSADREGRYFINSLLHVIVLRLTQVPYPV